MIFNNRLIFNGLHLSAVPIPFLNSCCFSIVALYGRTADPVPPDGIVVITHATIACADSQSLTIVKLLGVFALSGQTLDDFYKRMCLLASGIEFPFLISYRMCIVHHLGYALPLCLGHNDLEFCVFGGQPSTLHIPSV